MNGVIQKSFVNSVNGNVPDSSGNVTISFPVTSVNGATGDLYVQKLISLDFLASLVCGSLDFTEKDANDDIMYVQNSKGSVTDLYYNQRNKCFGYWRHDAENQVSWAGNFYDDSNHQPPYPVTAVNNQTGNVWVENLLNSDISGVFTNIDENFVGLAYYYKAIRRGALRLANSRYISDFCAIENINKDYNNVATVFDTARYSMQLTGTTLYVNYYV